MAVCNQCGQKIEPDAVPVAGPPRRRIASVTVHPVEYTPDEWTYMRAVDSWRAKHRRIPTCSEQLAILVGLGYRKLTDAAA